VISSHVLEVIDRGGISFVESGSSTALFYLKSSVQVYASVGDGSLALSTGFGFEKVQCFALAELFGIISRNFNREVMLVVGLQNFFDVLFVILIALPFDLPIFQIVIFLNQFLFSCSFVGLVLKLLFLLLFDLCNFLLVFPKLFGFGDGSYSLLFDQLFLILLNPRHSILISFL
jgi:hypothetical protein